MGGIEKIQPQEAGQTNFNFGEEVLDCSDIEEKSDYFAYSEGERSRMLSVIRKAISEGKFEKLSPRLKNFFELNKKIMEGNGEDNPYEEGFN